MPTNPTWEETQPETAQAMPTWEGTQPDTVSTSTQPVAQDATATTTSTSQPQSEEGLISKAWGFLTRPLAKIDLSPSSIVEAARQFTASSLGVDPSVLSQKPTEQSVKSAMQQSKVLAASVGMVKGLEGIDSFFTSPLGIATLGLGSLPATAQRLVAAGFSAQMISQTPELARQLGEELGKPDDQRDYQKIGQLVTESAANTGFSVAGVLHAAKAPVKPATQLEAAADKTAQVAPAAASALKEQAAKGSENAIQRQTEEVLQPVQQPSGEGAREVPAEGAGQEAGARSEQDVSQEKQERITSAAYRDEEGDFYTGANHPEILEQLGVEGYDTPESRNTPQFGFMTDKGRFITREEAGPVATKSGQNLKDFDPGEPVHSDEVASPTQPDKPLGDVPQPVQAKSPSAQIEKVSAMGGEQFYQYAKGGKATEESYALGRSIKTPEELAQLVAARDKANQEFQQLVGKAKTEDDLQDVAKLATKGQYFSEAIGAATGTGSAGENLRSSDPDYVPNFSEEKSGEPISVGPGAASPGDVPAAGRQAIAAGARVENAPPASRPMGPVSSVSISLNQLRNRLATGLKGLVGESMPKTTAANREAGEAGVRYGASKVAAPFAARAFTARALEGTGVDPIEFGAALTEDNLRSIRESLRQKATELRSIGDEQGADAATEQADYVATMIGVRGSPFATEEDYLDYLERPEVKRAIEQHIQLWQEIIDPQYRMARGLDPTTPLPTRGQQTGARVNLKAVNPEDTPSKAVKGGVGTPSLTGTFKRRTPFGIRAKGTGQAYDVDYDSIIGNTFEKQLQIANKNAFDKKLVSSGQAVIDTPGQDITIGGERAIAFPLARRLVTADGRTFSLNRNIYVRQDLADEYRTVSNVDPRTKLPIVPAVMGMLNKAALAGFTDATVHFSNQMTALFNRPTTGNLLLNSLLSATGRADIPVVLTKMFIKNWKMRSKNVQQLAEMAEMGALRSSGGEQKGILHLSGRFLKRSDDLTRLMLDDTYNSLVDQGIVKYDETERREYDNQIGQYNRRMQGPIMRLFRDTGLGPFATAGRAFNVLGAKMATLSPGVTGADAFASTMLRANALSKWMGAAVLIGSMNYLLTKDKGGGVMGRKGTPIGDIDFGTNDASGKQLSFPALDILGLGRGLRVTGLKGAIEAKRLGLTTADAAEAGSRDIINSSTGPFAGPPVKAAFVGASGYPPAVEVGRASRVAAPGESQRLENIKQAVIEANPMVDSFVKYRQGKPMHEVLAGQIPRFTLVPRKTPEMIEKYPKIVSLAQGAAFIDDSIYQARRMDKDERRAFLSKQFERLPANQREHAWNEAERRHVFR